MWMIHTQAECRLAKVPATPPVAMSTVVEDELSLSDGSSADSFLDDASQESNTA